MRKHVTFSWFVSLLNSSLENLESRIVPGLRIRHLSKFGSGALYVEHRDIFKMMMYDILDNF